MGSADSSYFPDSLWRRWDDTEPDRHEAESFSDRHFFEFCAVPPFDSIGEDRTELASDDDTEPVYFLPTTARLLLRNVPLLVVLFLGFVLLEARVRPDVAGIGTVLPELPTGVLVALAVAAAVLVFVLVRSGLVDGETILKAILLYSLVGVLFAGSAYGGYLTLTRRGTEEAVPHVLYTFPTLLFTLIIGLFAYDLLLKGENLYTNLGRKNIVVGHHDTGETGPTGTTPTRSGDPNDPNDGKAAYEEIKTTVLLRQLQAGVEVPKLGVNIRFGYVFAVLVLSQYLVMWSFRGPLGTGLWSSLALNVTINLVVLVGVFNFLIGIVFLRNLLKGRYETEDGTVLRPRYLPFHPDNLGGFGDIGKLAMRINVIVILIGIYYVHRSYISGIRTFPNTADLPFDPLYAGFLGIEQTPIVDMTFWTINYVGPVFLYAIIVFVWFYYTFWEIHKQMAKQKKDLILEKQAERRNDGDERLRHLPLGEYEDKEDWAALYDAPEWPVDRQRLGGLITANLLPIVMSIPTVAIDLILATV